MNKYPTFSPNACNPVSTSACQCDFGDVDESAFCREHTQSFCVIAGDSKTALYVHLDNERCIRGISETDKDTWQPVNIEGYKYITLYARNMENHQLRFVLHGYPVAPLRDGNVVFLFHSGVLDCVSGIWEGEVEIEFKTGRIITAIEKVKFLINEDFSGHGSEIGHPSCHDRPDHLPEIPGVQQFPSFPTSDAPIEVIPEPLQAIKQRILSQSMQRQKSCCGGPTA